MQGVCAVKDSASFVSTPPRLINCFCKFFVFGVVMCVVAAAVVKLTTFPRCLERERERERGLESFKKFLLHPLID